MCVCPVRSIDRSPLSLPPQVYYRAIVGASHPPAPPSGGWQVLQVVSLSGRWASRVTACHRASPSLRPLSLSGREGGREGGEGGRRTGGGQWQEEGLEAMPLSHARTHARTHTTHNETKRNEGSLSALFTTRRETRRDERGAATRHTWCCIDDD